jgi:hypothetical protein
VSNSASLARRVYRSHNQERRRRARSRSLYMSMFLDGFVAGPTAGSENALGDGCFR